MEDPQKSHSVYELLTKLCEKLLYAQDVHPSARKIKKLRSSAYEILLSKKTSPKDGTPLSNNNDPFCQLLAWEFELIMIYGLKDHADKLKKSVQTVQTRWGENNYCLNNVLFFLIHLCQAPDDTTTRVPIPETSNSMFKYYDNNIFELPLPMICSNSQFKNTNFYLNTKSNNLKLRNAVLMKSKSSCTCIKYKQKSCSDLQIHGINNTDEELIMNEAENENIWEIVSNLKITKLRTWENFGSSVPQKEFPFLTESDSKTSSYAHQLLINRYASIIGAPLKKKRKISITQFIKDIKYLLVGIASKTFTCDTLGNFTLATDLSIEGLSPMALESYCEDLIFCGYCYNGLNNMCLRKINRGYIFTEFCESIQRYLSYYRTVALSVSETSNLFEIHNFFRQLRSHISVLAQTCKVGPFAESQEIPHGVALLNYLYQKVLTVTNKDVLMVLFSVLYPCCQVYINRFLQTWIFEGVINDPYKEFFVDVTPKYISTRGRTYWTRSFAIVDTMSLEFLSGIKNDILLCGKAMNLLKLCVPDSPLRLFLMKTKPIALSFYLSTDQILTLQQNIETYYLEAITECGPKFSITNLLTFSKEQESIFLSLVSRKRAVTLKRLELQKLKLIEEANKKKQEKIKVLREQYDNALKSKQNRLAEDVEREIQITESFAKLEKMREKIIQLEATNLIQFYDKLFEETDKRQVSIEKNIAKLKKMNVDEDILMEKIKLESSSSTDSFLSTVDDLAEQDGTNKALSEIKTATPDMLDTKANDGDTEKLKSPIQEIVEIDVSKIISSKSLDELNANIEEDSKKKEFEELRALALENFAAAKRNKEKILNVEMGIKYNSTEIVKPIESDQNIGLTELQRNLLKVMSSEFGIDVKKCLPNKKEKQTNALQINRQNMMQSNQCFYEGDRISCRVDNENFLNKNIDARNETIGDSIFNNTNENDNKIVKSKDSNDNTKTNIKSKEVSGNKSTLFLNLEPNNATIETCLEPMSISSTPLSDFSHHDTHSPPLNKLHLDIEPQQFESLPSCSLLQTAATNATDEGFYFDPKKSKGPHLNLIDTLSYSLSKENKLLSKRLSIEEAKKISTNCIRLFLYKSISIPVMTQLKLVNNELLRHFVKDLNYLVHLNSLRNYFFLLDGEFARNITEGLFEMLYDANFPIDIINCKTLQHLVYNALDYSCKFQENSNCLSFKINNLPVTFDLCDPNVLDCLSLTYQVQWPLNILLPSDTIGKYDEVFKYLLKLHRVSWVLKKMFQELKILAKEVGTREIYLMLSPEYARLQQCRHIMTHFIQTLQNYVVGDVLQTSWELFEKDLMSVTNLDQLYLAHTTYIKNILFMCLLNQRSAPIRQVIQNIFVVIFKFYDYLRAKNWIYEDGVYSHPNYKKLNDIFANFEKCVQYLFKACRKVARSGYQPHLIQFLDTLDINNYYTNKINAEAINILR